MRNFLVCYCVLVLVNSEKILKRRETSSLIGASTQLCGSGTEIELTKSGETSSMIVTLSPIDPDSMCKMRVTAPRTHVINMQFIESSANISQELTRNYSEPHHPPCVMSIFLPENRRIPVWKGDLCSKNPLTEVDLLTSDFKIIWNPPSNLSFTMGRKFLLTAVGRGEVCKESGQHTCMRIGWDPMMCVSDSLVCNGFQNCPKSSTTSDEDEKLCTENFYVPKSFGQLAVEIYKKYRPSPKRPCFDWGEWHQEVKTTETSTPAATTTTTAVTAKKQKATDSISQVLSKYGPWGYLMLGMLICGTVLMFCGLWECCFRKPKAEIDPLPTHTQPTTVLIINPQQEEVRNPPNYDELDQPPSYTTLFPNNCNVRESDSGEPSMNSCETLESVQSERNQENGDET